MRSTQAWQYNKLDQCLSLMLSNTPPQTLQQSKRRVGAVCILGDTWSEEVAWWRSCRASRRPYYNNPQALFNLYKPVHTPQPTHTPQHTSSASTTTPTQSPTTHPQSTTTSMSISPHTPCSSWKPLPPPPLPLPKPSSCLSTNPFSSLTTDPLPPSSTSHTRVQPAAHSSTHLHQKSLPSAKLKSSSTTKNLDPPRV